MATVAGWGVKSGSNKSSGNKKSGLKAATDYITNEEKTTISDDDLQKKKESLAEETEKIEKEEMREISGEGVSNVIGYMGNEQKTVTENNHKLVSGVNCNPDTAVDEFLFYEKRYHAVKDENLATGSVANQAVHFYMSFKGTNYDPEEIHQMGIELAQRVCGDSFQCVVATHLNTGNYHNHLLFGAYSMDERNGKPYKWHQSIGRVKELRQISDEISLEHGIPIIINPEEHGASYKEWQSIQNGNSWKEQLRIDIDSTKEVSRNWQDFSRYMRAAGYKITANEHSYTYTCPGSDLSVRDTKLGKTYTRNSLDAYWDAKNIDKEVEDINEEIDWQEKKRKKDFEEQMRVSRYSAFGRRRGDIELLLLFAIKLIKAVADLFFDRDGAERYPENPIYKKASYKTRSLIETMRIVREEGIQTPEDLQKKIMAVGSELSHLTSIIQKDESDLSAMEETMKNIQTVLTLADHIGELGITNEMLNIEKPEREEVLELSAEQCPMSKHQNQKLYELLEKNPDYHMKYKYAETTTFEADKIISFLKDPENTEQPDTLLNNEQWLQERLIKKYKKRQQETDSLLRQKNSGPATQQQINTLEKMAKSDIYKEQLKNVDIKVFTKYDAIKVVNYLTRSNPLNIPKLSSEDKRTVVDLIAKHSDQKLYKPIEQLTKRDFREITGYLNKKTTKIPEALKEIEPIRDNDKKQIAELLQIHPTIESPKNIDGLSHNDALRFISFMIDENTTPSILEKSEKKENIKDLLLKYPLEEQETIMEYSKALTELYAVGLDTKDLINQYVKNYRSKETTLEANKALRIEDKIEYKKLKRVAYTLNLAQNPQYVYGPAYKGKEEINIKEITENINELQENEKDKMEDIELDKEIEKEEEDNNGKDYMQEDKYFEEKNREEDR